MGPTAAAWSRWLVALVVIAALVPGGASGRQGNDDDRRSPDARGEAPYRAGDLASLPSNGGYVPLVVSPDGDRFLSIHQGEDSGPDDPSVVCARDVMGQAADRCVSVPVRTIDRERVAWSPDGTRLALSEETLFRGQDGDIWVIDFTAEEGINLTPDGFEGRWLSTDPNLVREGTPVDSLPVWAPDGASIAFTRSVILGGAPSTTAIWRVPAGGGEAEEIVTIPIDQPFAIPAGLHWPEPGKIYASVLGSSQPNPANGIWQVSTDSGEMRQVVLEDVGDDGTDEGPDADDDVPGEIRSTTPILTAMGASRMGVLGYPIVRARGSHQAAVMFLAPDIATIDLNTGAIRPLVPPDDVTGEDEVVAAAPSPDGRWLALAVHQGDGVWRIVVQRMSDPSESYVLRGDIASRYLPVSTDLFPAMAWSPETTLLVRTIMGEVAIVAIEPTGMPDRT